MLRLLVKLKIQFRTLNIVFFYNKEYPYYKQLKDDINISSERLVLISCRVYIYI